MLLFSLLLVTTESEKLKQEIEILTEENDHAISDAALAQERLDFLLLHI